MEDEDLELLRLAALQTLQKKNSKDARPVEPIKPVQIQQQQLNPRAAPFIPTQGVPPQQQWNNFPPVVVPPQQHYNIPPAMPPFLPTNMMPTPPGVVAVNVPLSIIPVAQPSHVPSVQLSPRSAAFVSQNNDIIMRRKYEKSPGNRSPYRNSPPSRWSPSPPRQRRHASRSKSPIPVQRSYRDKSLSPVRRRDSPVAKKNGRWNPNLNRNSPPNRRRSPRRSPLRKRSNSKSPGRRINRNNGRRPLRRPSPHARSTNNRRDLSPPPNKKRKSEERKNDVTKRKSPEKAKSRSKSRSLSPGADLAAVLEKLDDDYDMFPILDETEPDIPEVEEAPSPETPMEVEQKPATPEKPKVEQIVKKYEDDMNEDELLGLSDDEISLGGNDIELDDLFNSDDSESENEGRFKSGARNTKTKPAAVMPFSKLGASSVTTTVSSELPNDRREMNRNDDRRRREDMRRDWRSRPRQENSRKVEEVVKEESVVKKFKPLVDDKKRSNTPEIRVPSISSTVKTVPKEASAPEKRTIQLKRPIALSKEDSKVKDNITITTGGGGGGGTSSQKKDDAGGIRSSIRSRLGDKVSEKDNKQPLQRSVISAPGPATAKTVRTKITWKSEKV